MVIECPSRPMRGTSRPCCKRRLQGNAGEFEWRRPITIRHVTLGLVVYWGLERCRAPHLPEPMNDRFTTNSWEFWRGAVHLSDSVPSPHWPVALHTTASSNQPFPSGPPSSVSVLQQTGSASGKPLLPARGPEALDFELVMGACPVAASASHTADDCCQI